MTSQDWQLPQSVTPYVLPCGTYYRVAMSAASGRVFGANAPNPYAGWTVFVDGRVLDPQGKKAAAARVSPFADAARQIVPALYLAESQRAALHEIMLRPAERRRVTYEQVRHLAVIRLQVNTDLQLLNLLHDEIDLEKRYGPISARQLIESTRSAYPYTRLFVQDCYCAYPNIQGVLWQSRQCNSHHVFMLFGDRIDCSKQITVEHERSVLDEAPFNLWFNEAVSNKVPVDNRLLSLARLLLR